MSSRILAIDIQQDQISAALLTHGLKGIRIVETAMDKIAQETKNESFFQTTQDTLARIHSTMDVQHDRCIISIPSNYFFFRTLDLPFKNRKKNSQIISFELESYLPCPVESVTSDFCLFVKNSKDSFKTNMAGVASIQTHDLEKFKTLFDACHIHPDVVTTGSGYAEALVCAGAADLTAFLLFIYLEPFRASLYTVRFGEIVFIRTISINSPDPAHSIKTNLLQTLLSFDEFFNNSLDLNEIIVSGTASFIPDFCADIEKEMNVPVHEFNIFQSEKITPGSEPFSDHQYGLVQNAIAMGVNDIKGIESYNFTRHVSDFTLFYQENKQKIITFGVLSVLLFMAWAINPVIQMNKMKKTIKQLDVRIARVFNSSFPDVKTMVDPVHQMQVKVDALLKKKNIDFFNEYPLCVDLLNEISKSLPPSLDIVFSRFVRTENNLLVAGSADQFNTIDKMKNYFVDISVFKEVDINSASMDKKEKRVKFNLKILL